MGKADGGNTLFAEIIFAAVDFLPAGEQAAVPEVIATLLQPDPAFDHVAVAAEIVGLSVQFQPADVHDAAGVKIVGLSVDVLPAGVGGAVVVEIVASVLQLQPAGDRVGMEVPVEADTVLFYPSAAVNVIVVPHPAAPNQTEEQAQTYKNRQYQPFFCVQNNPSKGMVASILA